MSRLGDYLFKAKPKSSVYEFGQRGYRSPDRLSPTLYSNMPYEGPTIAPYPLDVQQIEQLVLHAPVALAIALNIRNEVWRKDLKLIPKWGAKCEGCGKEYEDGLERLRAEMLAGGAAGGGRNPHPRPGDEDGSATKSCPKCGYQWNPKVSMPKKCPKCDTILRKAFYKGFEADAQPESQDTAPSPPAADPSMQAEVDVLCEECGGILRAPDPEQKNEWEEFEHKVNIQGMDFHQIVETQENDANVFDDAYMIFRYEYYEDVNTGEAVREFDTQNFVKELIEIRRGNPLVMRIVIDAMGRRGKYAAYAAPNGSGYFTCLFHRENNIHPKGTNCPICGKETIPCEYVSYDRNGKPEIGFIEGEVFHWSKYSPTDTYGTSPWLTVWSEVLTLTNISRLASTIYQQYRPPKGFLIFRTRNVEDIQSQFQQAEEKLKVDPTYIPKIAVDAEVGERFVEWLPLTQDWQELQTLPLMKELRERIEAVFGVSNIMMGDTSTSGGLNNEGLQITVTLRTIERAQYIWSYKVFPKLLDALGITDWKLKFPPPVEEDRYAVLERRRVNLELMGTAMEMQDMPGVMITDEEDFAFRLTSPITHPRGMMPGAGSPVPGDPNNPNAGGEFNEDFQDTKPRGEITGKIPSGPGGEGAKKSADSPFVDALMGALDNAISGMSIPDAPIPDAVRVEVDKFIAAARGGWAGQTLSEYARFIQYGVEQIMPGAPVDVNALAALEMQNGLMWDTYTDVGTELSREMNLRIIEAFVKPGAFDIDKLKRELQSVARTIAGPRLEAIARSEAMLMVNTGRELAYAAQEEGGELYQLLHTGDWRECDCCSEIVRRIGDGVSRPKLKEIIDDEARKKMGPRWVGRGLLPHPNCRGSLVKVSK